MIISERSRYSVSPGRLSKLLLCAAATGTCIFGSSMSTAQTSAGTSVCSETNSTLASCASSTPGPNGPETASAFSTATWFSSGGRLEATTNANGPGTSASAAVTFSSQLIVTGASGGGVLEVQFSGFQDTSGGNQPGTVDPLRVLVSTNSQSLTLPFGGPSPLTVSTSVAFGVSIPFSVSLSDSAMGSLFHGGGYQSEAADALLLEPVFVVTDANGNVISSAKVEFTPEPQSLLLIASTLPLLLVFLRKSRVR